MLIGYVGGGVADAVLLLLDVRELVALEDSPSGFSSLMCSLPLPSMDESRDPEAAEEGLEAIS
jgi:hypothetical protein